MRTSLSSVLASSLLLFAATDAHAQATTTTTNQWVDVQGAVAFNYCNGELVIFGGQLHLVTHVTITPTGRINGTFQSNPNALIGVGVSTGDIYIGTGHVSSTSSFTPGAFPNISTIRNDFRATRQGSSDVFEVTTFQHVTINANGDATSTVDITEIGCVN